MRKITRCTVKTFSSLSCRPAPRCMVSREKEPDVNSYKSNSENEKKPTEKTVTTATYGNGSVLLGLLGLALNVARGLRCALPGLRRAPRVGVGGLLAGDRHRSEADSATDDVAAAAAGDAAGAAAGAATPPPLITEGDPADADSPDVTAGENMFVTSPSETVAAAMPGDLCATATCRCWGCCCCC